jgi:isocitrate dehydrogenase
VHFYYDTVPSKDGETEEFDVFNFEGAGGVALSMYNTDEVISSPIFVFNFL